jgi:hypothetical protein
MFYHSNLPWWPLQGAGTGERLDRKGWPTIRDGGQSNNFVPTFTNYSELARKASKCTLWANKG